MKKIEILEMIENGEGLKVEFKPSLSDIDRITEVVCSFANLKGGTVLVGVSDIIDKHVPDFFVIKKVGNCLLCHHTWAYVTVLCYLVHRINEFPALGNSNAESCFRVTCPL